MKEFFSQLDKDIKRCETVLKENNYLEIVIAVEELIDKYKLKIDNINLDNDRVWNYSKKDLETIKERLIQFRNEHKVEITVNGILKNLVDIKEIEEYKLEEVKNIIIEIEKIHNSDDIIEDKWNHLKQYLSYACNENIYIAQSIIELINTILKIEQNRG